VEQLVVWLQQQWPGLSIWASKREHDPVTWV
jgi:hypothetical protein